jgi:acyl carrier protein
METMERLTELFKDKLDVPEGTLLPEATLDSLGLDSLDKIEFLFTLEEEFRIRIDERSKRINTLRDMADLIDVIAAEQQAAVRV